MQKRILSLVVIFALLLSFLPVTYTVRAEDSGDVIRGDYIYSLSADPDTGTVPSGFGTPESNGRIWTDKSVSVNDDHFDVNLKVLAQEYVSTYETSITQSIAADVLFILDFTTSMNNNSDVEMENGSNVSRLSAMVDAVNEAIEIITTTNPNNRIKVFRFSGSSTYCAQYSKEIMPLAHYTSSSTSTDTKNKYITLSGSNTVKSSNTLLKDGASFSFSESTQQQTCTQYGIAAGIDDFIDDINAETDNSIERKPYVIMLTDGEPTLASKNWNAEDVSQLRTNTITYNSGGDRYELMATGAILSSAIWKDRLAEAYKQYNGGTKDVAVDWFNIGLGIAEPAEGEDPNYTACLLNPYYLQGVEGRNGSGATSAEKIKYYMGQSDWAPKETSKDYSDDANYTYVNEGDGFVTFANTYAVLMNAFVTLANIIKMGSAEYVIPIIYHEGSGEQESDVEFTDVIGEGMYVDGITLKPNGKPPVVGSDSDGDGVYTFEGYNTTVTITEDVNGQQTLVWNLPANEVAMFTFKDRSDLMNGEYVPADPTTLTYGVQVTDEIGEGPGYTNDFESDKTPKTTVNYEIPGDNTYYFDVTTDSERQFVSSTLKSGLNSSTAKTDNVTNSASQSSVYSYTGRNEGTENSSAVASVKLGNNGKATLSGYHNELEITVKKEWQDINGEAITNTSSLPDIKIYLYRTADGGSTTELVEKTTLGNSNNYTKDWTVPRKDGGGNVYSYSVREDPPDGYYIVNNTGPLDGIDGTITVTNREMPSSGVIAVEKQWKNKIGANYTDTSSFAPIQAELWRKVNVHTPGQVNVKIYCTDGTNNYLVQNYNLAYGSVLKYKMRAYIRRQANAQGASFTRTIGSETVSVASNYGSANVGGTRWYRQTDEETFTVKEPMVITYTVSTAMNSGQMTQPYSLEDVTKTDSTNTTGTDTAAADEFVERKTLSNSNGWREYFDELPDVEAIDGQTYSYSYYVKEISAPEGFETSYSANNTNGITGGKLVITNTSTSNIPILPETGSAGSITVMSVGAITALSALAGALWLNECSRRKKRRKHLKNM